MDDWRVLELKFVFLCGKRIERVYNVEEHILKLRIFVLLVSCSIREQTKKEKLSFQISFPQQEFLWRE